MTVAYLLKIALLGMPALMLVACQALPPGPPFPRLPIMPAASPDHQDWTFRAAVQPPETDSAADKPTYILFMGSDRTAEYESWRTDSLILIVISPDREEITLVSLPRDWYVEVPGYRAMRINQVDFIGERQEPGHGPRLLSAVLERYMGIELDHWVRFHMDGFHEVFRLIEPIPMVLACPFYEPVWDARTGEMEWYYIPAGEVRMDAQTAFFYVRLRGFSSDFGRLARQRNLLWAVHRQMDRLTLLALVPELMTLLDKNVQTDLGLPDLLRWAQIGLSVAPDKVVGISMDWRFVRDARTPAGAAVQQLRSEEQLLDFIDEKERYASPLGTVDTQTCRLPLMPDSAFQRISQLGNFVPSLLRPGTSVALIAAPARPIPLRGAPGLQSDAIGALATGTALTILPHGAYPSQPVPATDHRWYYVETADRLRGWISDRYLRMVSP